MPARKIINTSSYDDFLLSIPKKLIDDYEYDSITAEQAASVIKSDLYALNKQHNESAAECYLFTSVEVRVKEKESFFKKLYKICKEKGPVHGVTEANLGKWYKDIHDLVGARFACPYYDEVEVAVANHIRPFLHDLNYAIDLGNDFPDKNYLDKGDERGYRSYHFFVKIPTPTSIYGDTSMFICEIQGRSELQHVWAVKSHDLLYKSDASESTINDMLQISQNLRAVDHYLAKIRKEVRGK